jgi:arylsulfatase A-like enzyme
MEDLERERRARESQEMELKDLYPSSLPPELHHSAWLADRACAYIREERPADRPFFAFVGFPDPHHPFTPCQDTSKRFKNREVKPAGDPGATGFKGSPWQDVFEQMSIAELSDQTKLDVARATYAMVTQIDTAVGRIMDALKSTGQWENTIVVFTSDHGDYLCDHQLLRKTEAASDSLLHVPCIVYAPGVDLSAYADVPTSNCDILPTLAALTGCEPPACLNGSNIVDRASEARAYAYCATGEPTKTNITVYDERFRFTVYPHAGYAELFDHADDPDETNNLAMDPMRHADGVRLLRDIETALPKHANPIVGKVCPF